MLAEAVESNEPAAVRALVRHGADWRDDDGETLLHVAARYGTPFRAEIFGMLLDEGVPIDGQDVYGHTPLFTCVFHGNIPAAEWLLRHGASTDVLDCDGCTALDLVDLGREPVTLQASCR